MNKAPGSSRAPVPVPRQLRPENDGKGHSGCQGLETIVMMDIWRIPAAQLAKLVELATKGKSDLHVFFFGYLLLSFHVLLL